MFMAYWRTYVHMFICSYVHKSSYVPKWELVFVGSYILASIVQYFIVCNQSGSKTSVAASIYFFFKVCVL